MKIFNFTIFLISLFFFGSCCRESPPAKDQEIQVIHVKFDTMAPGGLQITDIDTIIVKYKSLYRDSNSVVKKGIFFDTFIYKDKGLFSYKNITRDNITLGLNTVSPDTMTILAGAHSFMFSNAVLVISRSGRCNKTETIEKNEVTLNGLLFNLKNLNQTQGNYRIENGIFWVK